MNTHEVEKKAGFLVFPGLEELDLVGPWEMFSLWGKSLQGRADLDGGRHMRGN